MIKPIVTVLTLLLSMNVIADETTTLTPYKCHIETPNGSNIALFTWDAAQVVQEQSALLADYVPTITNERLIVKRVIECITEDKVFKDVLVREQDAQRTH
ncbi:TapY2 family type IVa secretion system protein [Shewanella inventionis]|nr:TapY2 family type IVa secretion system protein [Shewanella inventionis]MCL1157918.1 TapY2 family type IVa secretion system protein [Shewanella inventionis]